MTTATAAVTPGTVRSSRGKPVPIDPAACSTAEGTSVDGGERGESVGHCSSGRAEEQDMGKTVATSAAVLMVLSGLLEGEPAAGPDYWVEPMRKGELKGGRPLK